jgi:uncharacterized protein
MNHYALIYEVIDDYVARRAAFREEHLGYARTSEDRGELVLGGVFTDPVDQALLIFRAPDASIVEEFARHDPYVRNGLVKKWTVRPMAVAIGNRP